jgi:molybdopterin-synthase adenylyltransferase
MNIVLTGYRGTGKSAVARLLAKKLGWQSLSLDVMIARQEGRTIPEIVAARGWEYFRDVESALIADVTGRNEVILDTGGGAILRPQNVQALRKNSLVFWLKACPETIAARIKDSAARPALTQGKTFLEEIGEVLAERTPGYHAAADFEIETDGRTLEIIAEDILYYFARIAEPAAPGLAGPERSRYLRQMLIGGWGLRGQQRLRSATVFIAGGGGLGCPAALYLAAAGVGTIRLCDFGLVEASNLNRQILYTEADIGKEKALQAAEALQRLNPHVTVVPLFEKIDDTTIERLAGTADLMLDCLDNFETRHVLNRFAVRKSMPLVHAGIEGLAGQLSFIHPPHTPCLFCMFPGSPPAGRVFPVAGVTPGVIGTTQAAEALKWLTGIGSTLQGQLLFWDGTTMEFQKIPIARDVNCPVCSHAA